MQYYIQQWQQKNIYEVFEVTQDSPNIALKGELWGVINEYLGYNYNDTTLYIQSRVIPISTPQELWSVRAFVCFVVIWCMRFYPNRSGLQQWS